MLSWEEKPLESQILQQSGLILVNGGGRADRQRVDPTYQVESLCHLFGIGRSEPEQEEENNDENGHIAGQGTEFCRVCARN